MAWAYRLLMYCAVLPLLVYLWWRGRKDPAYRLRWRERFGLEQLHGCRGGAVLHCASVGEVIAARPLVERLLADARYQPLVLTCSTPTGSRLIEQHYGKRVGHQYFPFDLPGATRRFLVALQPRLVLLFERELWPTFLHQAQALGVPVALVNARLSAGSAAGYARWRGLMAPALVSLRLVCAEDTVTAGRLRSLGVPEHRLRVNGNMKSDIGLPAGLPQSIEAAQTQLGGRPVLTAGSTHAGEDEALVAAFKKHLEVMPQTLLILVPRHPERFQPVADLLTRAGLLFARHSLGHVAQPATQVLLGDTLGELLLWYGVADACFVGGSLVQRGGHNPLEVLCLKKPLIAGRYTSNFDQLYKTLHQAGGMLAAHDGDAVFEQFRMLLSDPSAAAKTVESGSQVYRNMAGATDRTMADLDALLGPRPRHTAQAPGVLHAGHELLVFDPACFSTADPNLFEPAWWRRHGASSSRTIGRGQVHFVSDQRSAYLLRHYHRGGMAARVSSDLFFAPAGIERGRAIAEFDLLRRLRARGLPVPRACAARHTRIGWCYRADILVERIPDATDVAELLLSQRCITELEWRVLGCAVRQLHEEQVCHADWNCHNLMLDARGKAWIVDFDKSGFRAGESWKQRNLNRLLRSLRKELRLDALFRWNEQDWQHFLSGYQQVPGARTGQLDEGQGGQTVSAPET